MIVGFIDVSPSMVIGRVWDRVPYAYITGDRAVASCRECVMVYPSRIHLYIKVLDR